MANGGSLYTYTTSSNEFTASTSAPASSNWVPVAVSSDGNYAFAGINGGSLYMSVEQGAWNPITNVASDAWRSIQTSNNGQVVVASADSGNIYISQTYGTTWQQVWTNSTSSSPIWYGLALNGTYIYAGDISGQFGLQNYLYLGLLGNATVDTLSFTNSNYPCPGIVSIQTGYSNPTSNGNSSYTVSFGQPFANAPYVTMNLFANPALSTVNTYTPFITNITANNFTYILYSTSSDTPNYNIMWIAVETTNVLA